MHLNPTLRSRVRQGAEDRPGVYRMLGPGDELLYVGKSVRVKSRLLSYFRADPGEKAGKLIRDTESIEWEYLPNEFTALVREMRLIKRWRPRFNVEHKRKRRFAFIKITREPAPRVIPVGKALPDGATYFGPFPRPRFLATTLRDLAHLLGLRDCGVGVPTIFDDQLEMFRSGRPPLCLRAETGSCLGPCCGKCSSADYGRRMMEARRFLEGKSGTPVTRLRKEMEAASEALEYEYAAWCRDRLLRLEEFQRHVVAFRGRVEELSFVYRVPGFKGEDRLYVIRKGVVEEELPYPATRKERDVVSARVREIFGRPVPDPGSLSQEAASEILLVARWFRLRKREMERTLLPGEWLEKYAPSAPAA